jgi:DNA-binding transcriptional regulator YhcF (GntR family)
MRSHIVGDERIVDGDRLPSARELADKFGVNVHTVLRALRVLREEGCVRFRRGRPVTVLKNTSRDAGTQVQELRRVMQDALQSGVSPLQIQFLLDDATAASYKQSSFHDFW